MVKTPNRTQPKISVLIPCFNEEQTIAKVIHDFRKELPHADIYVFDNNSQDATASLAAENGAIVVKEKRQGKGHVINSMFTDVVSDVYVMVDGDDTYPASSVHELIAPVVNEEADMVVGQRLSSYTEGAFPPLHVLGNKLVCSLVNSVFSTNLKDPMSGYRAFNRKVTMQCPVVATGFDVETEMTLQLLYRHLKITEVEINYRERPAGSYSKLRTFSDGLKVINKIFSIIPSYKPLTFFGGISLGLAVTSLFVGSFVIREYIRYQYIYSVPKAVLATGLMIFAGILLAVGIILHVLNFRLLEESNNNQKMFSLLDRSLREK